MRILIIGSEGFIGKNCRDYFLSLNYTVSCCDIVEKSEENYFRLTSTAPDFDSVFQFCLPDVCINASGSADVSFSIEHPEKDFELNVKNVGRILEAIKNRIPTCRFINISSAAVYGNPKSLPIKESDPTNPLSPYGINKLKSEKLLNEYFQKYGLRTCSLRIFSAYGPGLKKQLFWDIYQKALKEKEIKHFVNRRKYSFRAFQPFPFILSIRSRANYPPLRSLH